MIILSLILNSCRCKTNFNIISENSKNLKNSGIEVSAGIWEGQFEFINFNIRIPRMDSLYVKNIIVKPELKKGTFPKFSDYRMFSNYKVENGKLERKNYKEQYIERNFQNLPKEIRKTNIGNDIVDYSITYSDNKNINITNFSANVKVILTDKLEREIILETNYEFYGENECYFSIH
jgi:hypothetical protein